MAVPRLLWPILALIAFKLMIEVVPKPLVAVAAFAGAAFVLRGRQKAAGASGEDSKVSQEVLDLAKRELEQKQATEQNKAKKKAQRQKQMAARDAKREKKRAAEERRQRAASGGGSGAKRKGGYDSSSSDDDLDRLTRLARPKDAKKLLSRSAAKGAGSLSPLDRSPRLPTVSGLLSPKPGFDATGAYPVDESGRGEAQDGGWIETPRPFLHNVEAAKAATLGDVDIRGDGDSSGRPPRGTRGRDRGKRARGSSGRTTSLSGSGSVDLGLSDGAKQRTGNRRR